MPDLGECQLIFHEDIYEVWSSENVFTKQQKLDFGGVQFKTFQSRFLCYISESRERDTFFTVEGMTSWTKQKFLLRI